MVHGFNFAPTVTITMSLNLYPLQEDASVYLILLLTILTIWAMGANLLDADVVGEKHGHAINAHAPASCGWQTILQRRAEALIYKHGFIIPR